MSQSTMRWPDGMTIRPLTRPGNTPADQRKPGPFRADWSETQNLLSIELRKLDAANVVCEMDVTERDLRVDGTPRARATPATPAIALAFDSMHGPLRYATDQYDSWRDNLRALALSLEALRKVDRYGVSRRGEQYTGWKAIAAAPVEPPLDVLLRHANLKIEHVEHMLGQPDFYRYLYRDAVRRVHPDNPDTGDADAFAEVVAAAARLKEAGEW